MNPKTRFFATPGTKRNQKELKGGEWEVNGSEWEVNGKWMGSKWEVNGTKSIQFGENYPTISAIILTKIRGPSSFII